MAQTEITNRSFAETNEMFKKCCELAKIKATKRQASKFKRNRGKAYTFKTVAKGQDNE